MRLAAALGWPGMPWQAQVTDVIGEVDPVTGEWAYPIVVLIVQRQAGKTTIVGSTGLHRALAGPERGIWYTAQRRQDARDNWMNLVKRLRRSPLKGVIKIRESNGSETITVLPTGSEYRIFAPAEDALHGKATDLVMVDEAWRFDEPQGDALTQAIVPTFATRPGQMVILSAAGTARSTWLLGLRDTGRAFVEAGRTDTFAYFEWGIGDDVDPADLGAVALAHPGYGFTLRPSGLIQAAATMKVEEFARAYGSRWTGAATRAVPAVLWATGIDALTPLASRFAIAFEVGLAGGDAAIGAAWRDESGQAHVELADVREQAAWLVPRLGEITEAHQPPAIAYDRYGPAVAAGDAALRAGLPVTGLSTDEYVTACATFLEELVAGRLHYRPHPALDDAVAAAVKRPVGDRWAWGRRSSTATIAALVAVTIALWAYDHAPPTPPPFKVR